LAVWKCAECGNVVEARCKPGKCQACGAAKDRLIKDESAGKKKA
jgi:ABC-type ATPase with predicted acetyltransferase domain